MVMRPKAAKAPTVVSNTCTPFSHQRPLSSFQRFSDSSLTTGSRGAVGHHRGSGGGAVPAAGGVTAQAEVGGPGPGAGEGAARRRLRPGTGSEGSHGRQLVEGRERDKGLDRRAHLPGHPFTCTPAPQRNPTLSSVEETPSTLLATATSLKNNLPASKKFFPLIPL